MPEVDNRDACATDSIAQAFPILAASNRMRMEKPERDLTVGGRLAEPYRANPIEELPCLEASLVLPAEMKQRRGLPPGKGFRHVVGPINPFDRLEVVASHELKHGTIGPVQRRRRAGGLERVAHEF